MESKIHVPVCHACYRRIPTNYIVIGDKTFCQGNDDCRRPHSKKKRAEIDEEYRKALINHKLK